MKNEAMGTQHEGNQDAPYKTCACGASYTREAWGRLEYVGLQHDAGEHGEPCEMRNCVCGSTISVELPGVAPIRPARMTFAECHAAIGRLVAPGPPGGKFSIRLHAFEDCNVTWEAYLADAKKLVNAETPEKLVDMVRVTLLHVGRDSMHVEDVRVSA
jgi:hypothetical protein